MRLRSVITPLALGLAARAFLRHQRARRAARDAGARHADNLASDPGDPVQRLDEIPELQATPLAVDALSVGDVEAAQDLASLEAELDEIAVSDDAALDDITVSDDAALERPDVGDVSVDVLESARDAGDLYGGHTPPALDPDLPDDDQAAMEGQTWIEALEASAIEHGAEPERELDDIVDDEDVLRPPHASRTRDTPVADHGSGGRRGL